MADPLYTVFSALADPTRRAILSMLLEDDMAVTDVAEPIAMSLAAISKLQKLTTTTWQYPSRSLICTDRAG